MNWIDVVYILIAGMVVWTEWDKGLGMIVADGLAWLVGIVAGKRLAEWLAPEIHFRTGINEQWLVAGLFFLITVWMVFGLLRITTAGFNKLPNQNLSSGWQQVLGGVLAVGYAVLLLTFITFILDQLYFLNGARAAMEASWFYEVVYVKVLEMMG